MNWQADDGGPPADWVTTWDLLGGRRDPRSHAGATLIITFVDGSIMRIPYAAGALGPAQATLPNRLSLVMQKVDP